MSETESEQPEPGIADEQLPEDLQPGEDNPLAEPLPEDVDTAELDVTGGKTAEESEDGEEDDESDDGDDTDS